MSAASPDATETALGTLSSRPGEALAVVAGLDGLLSAVAAYMAAQADVGGITPGDADKRLREAAHGLAAAFGAPGVAVEGYDLRLVRLTPARWRSEVARHEAGHAVAAIVLGLGLQSVEILSPDSPTGGLTRTGSASAFLAHYAVRPPEEKRAQVEGAARRVIICLLSGLWAQALGDPDLVPSAEAIGEDLRVARHMTAVFGKVGLEEDLFAACYRLAALVVHACWPSVVAVAAALVARDRLSGSEVFGIVREALGAVRLGEVMGWFPESHT